MPDRMNCYCSGPRQPDPKGLLNFPHQRKEALKLQLWSTPSLERQLLLSRASNVFQVSDGTFKAIVSTYITPVQSDAWRGLALLWFPDSSADCSMIPRQNAGPSALCSTLWFFFVSSSPHFPFSFHFFISQSVLCGGSNSYCPMSIWIMHLTEYCTNHSHCIRGQNAKKWLPLWALVLDSSEHCTGYSI